MFVWGHCGKCHVSCVKVGDRVCSVMIHVRVSRCVVCDATFRVTVYEMILISNPAPPHLNARYLPIFTDRSRPVAAQILLFHRLRGGRAYKLPTRLIPPSIPLVKVSVKGRRGKDKKRKEGKKGCGGRGRRGRVYRGKQRKGKGDAGGC